MTVCMMFIKTQCTLRKCCKIPGKWPTTLTMSKLGAKNLMVVFPCEVQGYQWQNSHMSLFTCVVYYFSRTHCYAFVSDDMHHNSALTLLMIKNIVKHMDEIVPLYGTFTYVSNDTAAHFEHLYQFLMQKARLYSVPIHGKNAWDSTGVSHRVSLHSLRSAGPYQYKQLYKQTNSYK